MQQLQLNRMEDSTVIEKETKNLPPTVITVDTKNKKEEADDEGSHSDRPLTNPETETRTPKHANTSLPGGVTEAGETEEKKEDATSEEPPNTEAVQQGFFAPRPYEGSMGGPNGAFQPRERLQQQLNQLMAMQHSPGTSRYYASPYSPGYEQRGPREYTQGPSPYGGHPHMYPPQHYHGSYQQRQGPPPGWGHHGVSYHNRPNFPAQHPGVAQSYQVGCPPNNTSTFSRTVSSSFDRSVKGRDSNKLDHSVVTGESSRVMAPPPQANDDRSVSDDGSWQQLNQIQSVDEEEIRRRLTAKGKSTKNHKEAEAKHPHSNSSSLTNSPTEEMEAAGMKKDTLPDPPKMTSSLDSLSSVASAQAPLVVKKKEPAKDDKPLSPSDSAAASLDLMKCESGSSNLLLPSHQRNLSQFSFEGNTAKRPLDTSQQEEVEGDSKQVSKDSAGEERPNKRIRTSSEVNDKKGSPLSITCSPTNADMKEDKSFNYAPTSKDSLFDKPPMYSYSIDSAPVMPREENGGNGEQSYPSFPARSHSSPSPTPPMPPMGDTGNDHHPGVSQIASWEIQGQDSFGGTSATNALATAFSFNQEYPVLSRNNSMLSHPLDATMPSKHHVMLGPPPMHHPHHPHLMHERHLESRNQSFEGGHYHGSFSRAESMSFESRSKGIPDARQGYHQPHYPPHAPSWGSQGSYAPPPPPPPHHYMHSPPYRMHVHPGMMRTFSHESGAGLPPNFQPPSEFQAPPTNLNKNRPRTEKHIMTTPFVASKSGVFGWTKEEDMRLTEIMKKHKNPRDWEPIAKELGRNRTAKECHERWIRYLKPGVRKGQWTDQEDAVVMEAVTNSKEQPFTRWSDLAQRLPGRVGKQIRDRWVNHLNPNINHLPFSREDDLLLWEGHQKLGKRWVEISTAFFKSTRSENHIKNRWYSASFKKFIANEFGPNAYSGSKPGRPPSKKDGGKKKRTSPLDDDGATTPVRV